MSRKRHISDIILCPLRRDYLNFGLQASNTTDLITRTRKKELACVSGRLNIRLSFHAVTRDVVILSSDRWH